MKKFLILTIGLLCISSAAIILKCIKLNSFAISFWRLLIASIIFLIFSKNRSNILNDLKKFLKPLLIASFFMAFHFILWITAFSYTDLSSNVILIVFQPISALFLDLIIFKKKITLKKIIAIIIALIGLFIIIKDDLNISIQYLFGDILGIIGVLFLTFFYCFTKKMKKDISFLNYIGLTYFLASIWCFITIVIYNKNIFITNTNDYFYLLLLIIFPTLTGHSLLNYSTYFFSLFSLNITIIFEPFLAIIFSYFIFNTIISIYEFIGGILLILSLLIGLFEEFDQQVLKKYN